MGGGRVSRLGFVLEQGMSARVRAAAGFLGQGSHRSRVCRLGFVLKQGLSVTVRPGAGFLA